MGRYFEMETGFILFIITTFPTFILVNSKKRSKKYIAVMILIQISWVYLLWRFITLIPLGGH